MCQFSEVYEEGECSKVNKMKMLDPAGNDTKEFCWWQVDQFTTCVGLCVLPVIYLESTYFHEHFKENILDLIC